MFSFTDIVRIFMAELRNTVELLKIIELVMELGKTRTGIGWNRDTDRFVIIEIYSHAL